MDCLKKAVTGVDFRHEANVYMEIYHGLDYDLGEAFLKNGEFIQMARPRFYEFAYGEHPELAKQQLLNYDNVELAPTGETAAKQKAIFGGRVQFLILNDRNDIQSNSVWRVKISAVHTFDDEAEQIAQRLAVAFQGFFLPVPYQIFSY